MDKQIHEHLTLILEIKDMLMRDWHVVTKLVDRDHNAAANLLAKKVLDGPCGVQILGPDAVYNIVNLAMSC